MLRYAVIEDKTREEWLPPLGFWLMDTCAGGTWSASFDDAVWFESPELAATALDDGEQEVDRETCSLVELKVDGPNVIAQRIIPWPPRPAAPLPAARIVK